MNISDLFPKISEDVRRLPKVAEQSLKFRFVQQLTRPNLVAHRMSLISSCVKTSFSEDIMFSY